MYKVKKWQLLESIEEKLGIERGNVNTNPTEGQKKAGNYRMGHVSVNGFMITIENPVGTYRRGKDKDGKEWKVKMPADYGYFVKTKGKDGDAIDVFIGKDYDSKKIYVIDQKLNGKFDESKVMFCFGSKKDAKDTYNEAYEEGWKGFWHITEVDMPLFKKWLYDGYRQRKPFYKYVEIKKNAIKTDRSDKETEEEEMPNSFCRRRSSYETEKPEMIQEQDTDSDYWYNDIMDRFEEKEPIAYRRMKHGTLGEKGFKNKLKAKSRQNPYRGMMKKKDMPF